MRLLALLFLIPLSAQAKDINIDVIYVIKQERVRPEPKVVHPELTQHFVLHESGTVDTTSQTRGKFPMHSQSSSRIGQILKVSDEQTVKKTWHLGPQKRELTITTVGTGCTATLKITNGAAEYKSFSTDLNTPAVYRNSEVESTRCRIE
jgi:hypothetical protein